MLLVTSSSFTPVCLAKMLGNVLKGFDRVVSGFVDAPSNNIVYLCTSELMSDKLVDGVVNLPLFG